MQENKAQNPTKVLSVCSKRGCKSTYPQMRHMSSRQKPLKTPRASLGSLAAGSPEVCLATDYLGPFPMTARGNRYILLLIDLFSKNVEIIPVPDMTAEVCACRILN